MARPSFETRAEYIGTGTKSDYTFDFKITDLSQILIIMTSNLFAEQFRVRGDDTTYISSVVLNKDGTGTVNLVSPLANTYRLYLELADDAPTQPMEFKDKSDFTIKRIEDLGDLLSGQIQRLFQLMGRAVKTTDLLPSNTVFDPTLPPLVGAANQSLVVNAAGTGLALGPTPQQLNDALTASLAAAQSAADAAVSEGNAATSETAAATSATQAATSKTLADAAAADALTSASAASASATAAAGSATAAAGSATTAAAHDILYGTGAPSNGIGVNGNAYIDVNTGTFYQKSSGAWVLKVVLTGTAGVVSFAGRTGLVVPVNGDYAVADITGLTAALATKLTAANNLSELTDVAAARTKLDIGDVDNTSDLDKPISDLTQTALNAKANLSGGNTFVGNQIFSDYILRSGAATITAFAGGGQASATQITKDINRVTTVATALDSVKLPSGTLGMMVFVQNDGANNLNIFPSTGQFINGLAVNTALPVKPAVNTLFVCVAAGVWKAISGGSALPLTTKGDTLVFNTDFDRLAVGANGTALVADSAQAAGVKWATPTDTSKVPISAFVAKGDVLVGTGVGIYGTLIVGTDGYILMADSTQAGGVKWAPTPATYVSLAFGTFLAPRSVVLATGITVAASHMSASANDQTIMAKASVAGLADVSANPQIQAGTVVGASMTLIGADSANAFTLNDGNGLSLNGPWNSFAKKALSLTWDGDTWTEIGRRD